MQLSMINLRDDQKEFLKEQKGSFNFSGFVREKLDGYIKFRKEVENDKKKIIG